MESILAMLKVFLRLLHRAHLLLLFIGIGVLLGATAGMVLTQRIVGVVIGTILGVWGMVYLFNRLEL